MFSPLQVTKTGIKTWVVVIIYVARLRILVWDTWLGKKKKKYFSINIWCPNLLWPTKIRYGLGSLYFVSISVFLLCTMHSLYLCVCFTLPAFLCFLIPLSLTVTQSGYCLVCLMWLCGLTVLMSTCVMCLCLYTLVFFPPLRRSILLSSVVSLLLCLCLFHPSLSLPFIKVLYYMCTHAHADRHTARKQ